MSIPRVSPEAIAEACGLVASQKIFDMDKKETDDYLIRYTERLVKQQPELSAFLKRVLDFHRKETKGMAMATSIPLFCSIILNALYIQEEMDDIGSIFKDME